MDWDSDEVDPMLVNSAVDISELSFSSSDDENWVDLPPWCKPLLPSSLVPPKDPIQNSATSSYVTNERIDNENGIQSFENPNYNLSSLDDALNQNSVIHSSNSASIITSNDTSLDGGLAALDSLYSELDQVCNLTRTSSVRNRRHYAQLDAGSMGVDVMKGPLTILEQTDYQNNSLVRGFWGNEEVMGRKKETPGGSHYSEFIIEGSQQKYQTDSLNTQFGNLQTIDNLESKNQNEKDPDKAMVSPAETDEVRDSLQKDPDSRQKDFQGPLRSSQIPHMTPFNSQDLYALPVKRPSMEESKEEEDNVEEKKDLPAEDILPYGWEKHEDNDGPYYWHIKSGTITRSPPDTTTLVQQPHAPLRVERRQHNEDQMMTRSSTSSALSELVEVRPRNKAYVVDNAYKRRSYPARSDLSDPGGSRPIRFAVRSLGWVEIAEEDLTPERSSKAVNRCIVDLSVGGKRDVLDVVGCWGDGKDLFMDLDEGSLKLVDPENLTLLNSQPIHTIRVWGVGRDNGRDFAYVARDKISRKHMCHVFRCDTPARTIANTLRDICKKIMIERSLQQTVLKTSETGQMSNTGVGRVNRPTNLPTERRVQRHSQIFSQQSFPTPMEEPKKLMKAQYVGSMLVSKPSGMELLNEAIQEIIVSNPGPWKPVTVAVAPSTVTITDDAEDGRQIAECRVRFLSFLGIGEDVKHCAFIKHTPQDQFIAYVFYCEPSSGALCKTIEAACKLRYQKCLDAHPGGGNRLKGDEMSQRSISGALRSVFTSFTGKKSRSTES